MDTHHLAPFTGHLMLLGNYISPVEASVGSGVRKDVWQVLRFVLGREARTLEVQPDNGDNGDDDDDHEGDNQGCHLKGLANIRGSHQLSSAVAFAKSFDH